MLEVTCCGQRVTGATMRDVIVGRCGICLRILARVNPKTGNVEEVTGNDAWNEMPRKVLMSREEFRTRRTRRPA